MLGKTEFIVSVKKAISNQNPTFTRLRTCKAWVADVYVDGWGLVAVLKSYETIVAAYAVNYGTIYVFDRYSATTDQHVSKFINVMTPKQVIYLYRRSDGVIVRSFVYNDVERLSKEQFNKVCFNNFCLYF